MTKSPRLLSRWNFAVGTCCLINTRPPSPCSCNMSCRVQYDSFLLIMSYLASRMGSGRGTFWKPLTFRWIMAETSCRENHFSVSKVDSGCQRFQCDWMPSSHPGGCLQSTHWESCLRTSGLWSSAVSDDSFLDCAINTTCPHRGHFSGWE